MPRPVLAFAGAAGLLLALALLLGLGFTAIYRLTRTSGDGIALSIWLLPLSLPLLYWTLYSIGHFFLVRNAAHPGSIEIGTPSAPSGVRADEVIAELREALTSVDLFSTSAVPGVSASGDLLSDVHTEDTAAPTWWGPLLAVLKPSRWRNAYRVSVTIRQDGADRVGLTVEVSSRVSHDVSTDTIWGSTLPEVAQRAACHVAAYVLPRTRLSRRPPWTPWRGIELDPELFFRFHEARRLTLAGRLEEALEQFEHAIARDPLNPYVRIEQAMVLDQLGLYIDALATYVDVVTAESWYHRWVWRHYRRIMGDRRYRRSGPRRTDRSPSGAAALQLARFRMMGSLAASDRLAEQWCRHQRADVLRRQPRPDASGRVVASQPRRLEEAARVIFRLRYLLAPYGNRMLASHGEQRAPDPHRPRRWWHRTPATARPRLSVADFETSWDDTPETVEDRRQLLRRVLQYAAMEEGVALARDYRWFRAWRRPWWRSLPISQAALRVLPAWAALQYRYVATVQQRTGEPQRLRDIPKARRRFVSSRETWRVRRRLGDGDGMWPPDPRKVERLVRRALGRRRQWQAHYNAACTYAVSLLTPDLYDPAEIDQYRRKLSELKEARDDFTGLQRVADESEQTKARLQRQADELQRQAAARPELAPELAPQLTAVVEQFQQLTATAIKRRDGAARMDEPDHQRLRQELRTASSQRNQEVARHRALVRLAVDQLIQALVATDGQFAVGRSPWLRLGDQDLDDLRVTMEYKAFVDRYLPAPGLSLDLPRNAAVLSIGGHLVQLVQQYAGLRRDSWRRRAEDRSPLTVAELREEARWWRQLDDYCRNCRDWPTRNQLIKLATAAGPDHPFDRSMPSLDTDRRWADRARQVIEDQDRDGAGPDGSPPAGSRARGASAWLERSRALASAAEEVKDERNRAFNQLAGYLAERTRGQTLPEILAGAGTPLPATPTARRLANAWTSIEECMDALRDQRHQADGGGGPATTVGPARAGQHLQRLRTQLSRESRYARWVTGPIRAARGRLGRSSGPDGAGARP